MKTFVRPAISRTLAATVLALLALLAAPLTAGALGSPNPQQSGSVGLEGRIPSPPPTQAASIATPGNGQSFTSSPITVAGLCKTGLLVKIFANNVFVGSVMCANGSFSLKVDLFSGQNDLVARVYDNLDQSGPDSNAVTVTFNDANFAQFGTSVLLTSTYARRGANPGEPLTWPIILSGGVGPYALSIDWGDSSGTSLMSVSFPGTVNITHTFSNAGVYGVVVKASDHNGSSAYLQLVAIANGQASQNGSGTVSNATVTTRYTPPWFLYLAIIPLLMFAFWLGARNELFTIRKRLERSRTE